ncbi:MAG TPA: succinate--CoA ligase subunit beta [Nitrososphaeraceae archaeon]|nr:succinate--CoA ligase subunit beta [Nitrososphaeraceae archaeon]HJT82965.1 succinate--CoA ligase subunit beta [Nitrososphaeraceae archaeon]
MKLLEYQGKELFNSYGISIPKSYLAKNIEQAENGSKIIGFPFVLKSQLTVGGRGKAGAILKCKTENELVEKFNELINKEVKGEKPRSILLEEMANIKKEFYLSIFLNRTKRCYSIIASSQGGVEIESVDNKVIIDIPVDSEGISKELASQVADKMNLNQSEKESFILLIQKLSKLIYEKEAELAEINPLAMLTDGELVALDAKVIIDDNALFRHEDLKQYEVLSELETQAKNNGFSFVELDGDIAIIGNGAGLVMSTLDMVTDAGGIAGAFLDFGGRATTESIYQALKVISRVEKIHVILVNLFGGIVRTDLVAQAILNAYNDGTIKVPVFARITGAESEKARELLNGSKARLYDTVEEAINEAVKYS